MPGFLMLRRNLFTKYALVIVALVAGVLTVAAAAQMLVIYRAQRVQVEHLLRTESQRAAERIAHYTSTILQAASTLNDFDPPGGRLDVHALRQEAWRLMRRHDAIAAITVTDGFGCISLRVSRVEPDSVVECGSASSRTVDAPRLALLRTSPRTFGPVYYPDGSEPYMNVTLPSRGTGTGVVEVQLSLKQIHATVAAIRFGEGGAAYVVDEQARLIAHPDMTLVLKQTDLAYLTHVREARADTVLATGVSGNRVLTTSWPVGTPPWRVFVEQPATKALGPVYESLLASLAVFALAILLAIAASFLLARRLATPILSLQHGAARLGAGDLSTRIPVEGRDEVAALAGEFNHMADRLEDSHAGLERRVAERTGELARAKVEAESANAAKTRFLAAASHDLRQPMHAISLLVGLLGERTRATPEAHLVDKVAASVQAMEALFTSLLDISKLDAGAVRPNIETFPVAHLLRRVELQFGAEAAQRGLELRVVPCTALVRSDPALLERIVNNLVANAIRYTPRGRVLVGFRRGAGVVRIAVIDTGIGIAAEHRDLVFEEFFQVTNPGRDRGNGLGLGLSIVKRSAELLGHRLSVRSEPGRGSVFEVEMPSIDAPRDHLAPQSGPDRTDSALRGAFVVIVDDDSDSRFACEVLFQQWGASVECAESADEALVKLGAHLREPELLVCDLRLRENDTGLEAISRLRRAMGEGTPTILITGDVGMVAAGSLDDDVVLLHKPVSAGKLRSAAVDLLRSRAPA